MKPILKALLLADHVYDDRATGKKVIAGTINSVAVSEVELRACAYVSLTGVHAAALLRLKYTDLENDKALREFEIDIISAEPLDIIELAVPSAPLPAPRGGSYVLELFAQNGNTLEPLGSHRVQTIENEAEGQ